MADTRPAVREPRDRSRAARAWLIATLGLTVLAFVAAIALAPAAGSSPSRALAWLLFLGSSVHVAATGSLYGLGEVRAHALSHRGRYIWVPLGLILATACAAAIIQPAAFTWLLLPYFAWQLFHFQKQNLGMASLAATSTAVRGLSRPERQALTATGIAGIAAVVAHPRLLGLRLPALGGAVPLAGVMFAAAAAAGLVALRRRDRRARPRGFCAAYVTSLLFFAPVFVCRSPYAAIGGMTIAHGLQYLLLVSLVAAGGHGEDATARRRARLAPVLVLLSCSLLGGWALSEASHLHNAGVAGRAVFGGYLGAAMAHFVVDAGMWRLRDAFPRVLLSTKTPYLLVLRSVDD